MLLVRCMASKVWPLITSVETALADRVTSFTPCPLEKVVLRRKILHTKCLRTSCHYHGLSMSAQRGSASRGHILALTAHKNWP